MAKYRYKPKKKKSKKGKIKRRLERKRSALGSRVFWYLALFVVVLASLVYFLFFSGFFKLEEVEVLGLDTILEIETESVLRQNLGANILLLNLGDLEKAILDLYPRIGEADIKKKLPGKLVLAAKEREAIARFCFESDECFLVDGEGVIFPEEIEVEEIPSGTSTEEVGVFSIEKYSQ